MAQTGQSKSSSRSDARAQATGTGQTAGSGRRPKPEDNTTSTVSPAEAQAEQTAAVAAVEGAQVQMDPEKHSLIVVAPNPKREGTIAYGFYAKYPKPGVLSDVFKARAADVRGKDLSWDSDPQRRHILLGKQALEFNEIAQGDPFGENRDACNEYLAKLGVPEKNRIKWGYMDKPTPAPAAETTPAQPETATA